MKIGILTFHSQLNYGGVLQCWALKKALEDMGYEVVVIDRWIDPKNASLNGPLGMFSAKTWFGIIIKSLFGCGQWRKVLRHWRTRRFVRNLGLTAYHFYDWKDAPQDLGVDLVVVGSDQVWHGGNWAYPTPDPYLLNGTEGRIPRAIAYAASFGMKALSTDGDFVAGFRNFEAISVREKEGVDLVRQTGYKGEVVHVVDPTLLIEPESWMKLVPAKRASGKRVLTCYFLSQDLNRAIPELESWAKRTGWYVNVLCDSFVRPLPRSVRQLIERLVDMLKGLKPSRVRISTGYGPREFVQAFAKAEATITDSFHAVMFSAIYKCNCRFLKPTLESRKAMFARIEEFSQKTIDGPFLVEDLRGALDSISQGDVCRYDWKTIEIDRGFSREWLRRAIGAESLSK